METVSELSAGGALGLGLYEDLRCPALWSQRRRKIKASTAKGKEASMDISCFPPRRRKGTAQNAHTTTKPMTRVMIHPIYAIIPWPKSLMRRAALWREI